MHLERIKAKEEERMEKGKEGGDRSSGEGEIRGGMDFPRAAMSDDD
jgi:hypothetical protein